MNEVGLYKLPADILRKGDADSAVVSFMERHGGFEEDDWLIVGTERFK